MSELQALALGLLQGLTEFLPVSSSGHLELANHLLNTSAEETLTFTLVVHAATILSTLVVFREDIRSLISHSFPFRRNPESLYLLKLLFSAVPVAFAGLFFREEVESLFTGNLFIVGGCLLLTSLLLAFTHFRRNHRALPGISWAHSFVIGLAQMAAVLPGLSRSGATIATGILLGYNRKETARFSFLMVIIPVLGVIFMDLFTKPHALSTSAGIGPLFIGFGAAFLSGLAACRWMIRIVSNSKLIYFALYCLVLGLIAIFAA